MRDPALKGSGEARLQQAVPMTQAVKHNMTTGFPGWPITASLGSNVKRFARILNRAGQLIPERVRSGG
jgi:hypothetical protein